MNKNEEKPEEKVDRLMLEAMEIANEHGIPYIAATERHSLLTGGTPKELLALSVYAEVQIAKEIKLPMEDLIRKVTRGIEIAYRAFEEKEEEKVKKEGLKVGDTVKVRTTRMREGKIGTVKSIVQRSNGSKIYSVQLNGDGYGSTFLEHEIEKVKPKKTPPRIVVYRDGDTVTARDLETGEEASAV